MFWLATVVIGRILAEPSSPPPDVADEALLLIKRHDVVIGCTPGDAGVMDDAATDADLDAAIDATPDGPTDAGVDDGGLDDGGLADAGMPDAGSCTMIPGDAITMIVQPHVSTSADGTRFAVLLVTPARPVIELKSHVFEPLEELTAPLIQTETVEVPDESLGTQCADVEACGGGGGGGCGGDWGGGSWTPPGLGDADLGDGGLVEETLGPYQLVRAQPSDTAELAGWLDQLGYAYMPEDLDAVAPYIELGYHVVAIRVAFEGAETIRLMPIALTWPGSELRIPAALGRATGVPPGRLTVYIAGEQKYVLPGADVPYAGYTNYADMTFLTRNEILLDQNQPPSADPVAIHPDNLSYHEVKVVTEYVHVPVEVECSDDGGGCCNDCNAQPRTRLDLGVLVVAIALTLRRRRSRPRA